MSPRYFVEGLVRCIIFPDSHQTKHLNRILYMQRLLPSPLYQFHETVVQLVGNHFPAVGVDFPTRLKYESVPSLVDCGLKFNCWQA